MSLLDYVYAVVPMLGILIFVHELGHFLVAKACGVRVLKFSLGFGSPVGFGRWRLRWERGGTEYVVAWFPLGGFVKMLGENLAVQGEDDPDAGIDAAPDEYLNAKPLWQKLAIIFAGPFMNLLLPVVAFVAVLWVGIPRPDAVVGSVELGSPAAVAGVEAGDRVLRVDGRPVRYWEDVRERIRDGGGERIALSLERDGEPLSVEIPVSSRRSLDEFGGVRDVGWIGLDDRRLPTLVGVLDTAVPAGEAGILSGDRVESVAGEAVEDWEDLREAFARASAVGGPVELGLARRLPGEGGPRGEPGQAPLEPATESLVVEVPPVSSLQELGLAPANVLVGAVSEGYPAARAGLRPGDWIVAAGGERIGSFRAFQERVRTGGGEPLVLSVARQGEWLEVTLTPEERVLEDPFGIEQKSYLIGITQALATLPGPTRLEQERDPLQSVPRAVGMTVEMTGRFLEGLGKIATGEVGRDKLAGPIGIAEIARKSLDLGWMAYLSTMILISINLGILNLLPIPVLDGGQALLFIVEGVKRSPLSMRTRELVQSLGLTVILMLMGLAFWNDISRNWKHFVDWLTGAGA